MNFTKKDFVLSTVIAVLIVALFIKSCENPTIKETLTVEVPESKGRFKPVEPEQIVISDKKATNVQKALGQNLSKKELEYWKAEAERMYSEYDSMLLEFKNSNDSIQQLKYKDVITPKMYSHTFDNDTLTAKVYGMYFGAIPTMSLSYTIKSQKLEIPNPKEVKFRMLAGVEVGNTKQFNDFSVKANVGFQLNSGAIFNLSADTEQRFYIGYTVPIFTIKR